MKKLYYILLLSTQYLIHVYASPRNAKHGRLNGSGGTLIEKGQVVERSTRMSNPWKKYMEKYDVEKTHGAGVRVDLGEDAEVKNSKYRIPGGKCPVFGKGIIIENSNVGFLTPVATGYRNLKSGGFAFPATGDHISPVTIEVLRKRYEEHADLMNLNDLSLCSKHASSFVISDDLNTSYRHPAVYDENTKTCYILYLSAQENIGPRYCSKDAADKDTMFCFKPAKTDNFKHYAYLSKNVVSDWDVKCPRKSLGVAKFGLWVDGNCEEIPSVKAFDADNLTECNRIVFEASASDQPTQYEENMTDYKKLEQGFRDNNPDMIKGAFLPVGAFNANFNKSKGKGFNWGNYDKINKKCFIFNVKPTCLINNKDFIATTALSHPEEVQEDFPCDIYKNEIEKELKRNSGNVKLYSLDGEKIVLPRIFISNNKDSLNCPCEPEKITNSSCDFYLCNCVEKRAEIKENNEVVIKDEFKEEYEYNEGNSNNKKTLIIIGLAGGVGILALASSFFFFKKKTENEKYDKMDQADVYGKSTTRKDEMLDPEASFWGEEKRASHTTPVLMEKPYY
ncbi:apical membrane antigen 1 [Plasmodium brasilianum]|uniref:Apical membrane antigen 1 n=1 Tax=Plasmodium brasilianum TaxID=5824 RepID=A0ACB9Y9W0_PLABR|nr:apical membrane antigen 1 [Plasmodium brasilianum]